MKNIYRLCYIIVLPVLMAGCKKDNMQPNTTKTTPVTIYKAPANFRVVGYIYEDDIEGGAATGFDMTRVNWLNIAFINPQADGTFASRAGLTDFITAAHKNNVKVMASLCGGDAPSYFTKLLTANNRTALINNLVQLVTDNNFDGVDVDIEDVAITSDYEPFVTALSAALKAQNKLMTAAVGTYESDQLSDKALSYYDYLNIMSYDLTGPWDPTHPGPHSPYSMAVSDLDFWTNTRGINKEKLNLGLPFYGYDFEATAATSVDYIDIVKKYPGAEDKDKVSTAGGGTLYYNGIPTIKSKTSLAMQNAGGVMIWELMADASGSKSLLSAIDQTANPGNN